MDRIILVDMDDTATWLLPVWVEWLNNKYGLSVDWHDIKKWDMTIPFPTLTKEQVYEPLATEEIWDKVTPRDGAVECLTSLHKRGFEIYICTSTDYRNVKPKYERVISKYFSFIDWKHVIVTSCKQLVYANFIIDDAPHNLINGIQRHKILMDMPHNENVDVKEYGITRMSGWKNLDNYISYVSLWDRVKNDN